MTTSDSASAADPQFQALVRSKFGDDLQAITALGARLIVGRDAPCSPVDGAALIAEAAQKGDMAAWAYTALLAAAGVGRSQSWEDAFDALKRAADLGERRSLRQMELLRDMGLRLAADVRNWLQPPTGKTLHATPKFVSFADFVTPDVCAYLIECATPKLIQAQVMDARQGVLKVDPMRTNTGAAFSLIDTDVVMQLIRARIANAAGVAVHALEPTEILHYSVGERYKPHVDFFHPALPNFAEQMRLKGQRIKTCLVYLNDDFDGGETDFPKLGLKFRGRTGEALVFENVRPNGTGDMNTVHAGLPPARGEKWLLSQWIRTKAQPVA